MPKKTTIEELALMIQQGFEHTATKEDLRRVEERLESKIDDLHAKVSAQTTSWQQDFDGLDGRVSQNETDIMALNKIVLKKR